MNSFKQLYLERLDYLKEEISSYKDESNIWKITGDIKNPPGNLCLHICGNLNHYLGSTLGKTSYVRDRDLEFSRKDISRGELIKGIEDTKNMIDKVFDSLNEKDFNSIYPLTSSGENVTIGYEIFRLIAHLNYHLGQINYHRRILEY